MAGLTDVIPVLQSPAIATYPYATISNGLGFTDFYGFIQITSTGTTYGLSETAYYSDGTSISVSGNPSASTDFQFKLSAFNFPQTIKGTGRVSLAYEATSGVAYTWQVIATLQKYDGSTTTDICTVTSQAFSKSAGTYDGNMILPLTIPETNFAQGDQLYLKLTPSVDGGIAGTKTLYVGCDPKNRTVLSMSFSTLTLSIPFKLNL